MGWTIDVVDYVVHQAQCRETGSPADWASNRGLGSERCGWTGTPHVDEQTAEDEALAHRKAHVGAYALHNAVLDCLACHARRNATGEYVAMCPRHTEQATEYA